MRSDGPRVSLRRIGFRKGKRPETTATPLRIRAQEADAQAQSHTPRVQFKRSNAPAHISSRISKQHDRVLRACVFRRFRGSSGTCDIFTSWEREKLRDFRRHLFRFFSFPAAITRSSYWEKRAKDRLIGWLVAASLRVTRRAVETSPRVGFTSSKEKSLARDSARKRRRHGRRTQAPTSQASTWRCAHGPSCIRRVMPTARALGIRSRVTVRRICKILACERSFANAQELILRLNCCDRWSRLRLWGH